MKYIGTILNTLLIGFMGVLLLFCFLLAGMQTKGFKQLVQKRLIEKAGQAGLLLSIGSIEGTLPFQWIFKDIHLETDPENSLDITTANLRLAFFPLFRKEIAISYLSLTKADLLFSESVSPIPYFPLPLTLSLRSLRAEKINVKKFETQEQGTFSLRGRGKLKKNREEFLAEVKIASTCSPNSFIHLYIQGNQLKKAHIEAAIQLKLKSTEAFQPFFTSPYESNGSLEARLKGNWKTWDSIFSDQANSTLPALEGEINGTLHKLEVPGFKAINRKWVLNSLFTLSAQRELVFNSLDLDSNLFHLKSSAQFDKNFQLTKAQIDFSFPQLNLLSLYSPILLKGSLSGHADLLAHSGILEMHGDQLCIGSQEYSQFSTLFKAKQENETWIARAEFLAKNPLIPITGHSDFTFNSKNQLTIKDFSITAPETTFAGNLFIDMTQKEIEGSFFGQILSLRPYRAWITPYSGLEGSLGAAFTFQGEDVQGDLLLKNFHCFNTFFDQTMIHCSLVDIFEKRHGRFSIEGEKLYLPSLYLSTYGFQTEWDGKEGPYQIYAKGQWKEALDIESEGYWTPDSLNISDLEGTLLKENFSLKNPFSITKESDHLKISECNLQFGEGHLSTALYLNKEYSTGYLRASHFPLDLFLISHPHFPIRGTTSIQACLEGNEEYLNGELDLSLEQLELYPSATRDPLHVKGSLHAKLDNHSLEFNTHFKASDEQFFTGNMKLPIDYTLFPFELSLNRYLPIAGKMALQGKIEEIFDFINIGSHRVSGLICSQLEIAQTLENPLLTGYLDLYEGRYENYYTGTHLKNIKAHLEAQGDRLTLQSFQANDADGGEASATGELQIGPHPNFLYKLRTDLTNINLIDFDRVDSYFTGPLLISGDQNSALAEGELTLSKAELTIPDTLPPDIPHIPVTHINRPPYLEAYTIQPLSLFPISLDIKLKVPGPIYLRGRGLRTEWKGEAHLSGTNSDIAAQGSLELMKGEFVFSGKVFSLSQGEITFTDQGAQHAYIHLKGELQLPTLNVTIILNGPLSSPLLTFQSTPYMPTSSILSHILFNKDISDITAFQALQVAQTIITLSGGAGPDVLEKIRKSIGVDRLNIISSSQNPDEAALQIGKYLTKGVMVTLAQGFNSSQIIVEVELKYGFLLQAETQEVEEGKFSLKWNRNY